MADITVRRERCGATLTAEFDVSRGVFVFLDVRPCEKCIEKANSDGFAEGREEDK
jgi:hypothetical protein